MDTLVAISTGVAYVFSAVNLLFPHLFHQHHHAQIYFESAGIVIFFVLLGKYLEDSAKNRASDSIKKLMELPLLPQPKHLYISFEGDTVKEGDFSL